MQARAEPERPFDPSKIKSLIQKDQAQLERPVTSQSTMDAPPSKTFAERQAAVLNRDPKAGTPGGAYDPSQPWRPASSLQDQAMGVSQARGQMNAGTCADFIQSRIERNWDLPIGGLSAETTIVRLRIELNRDGSLSRQPTIMDSSILAQLSSHG